MRINKKNLLPAILFLFALGAAVLLWIVKATEKEMRAELLQQARLVAKSIPADLLATLSGSEKDLDSAGYNRIKSLLGLMRSAKPDCRFLYLMGKGTDGKIFFFVDSLHPDAKDYASPGLVYDEVPQSYIHTFETRQEIVVGPVTDRWGTLITALIPIVSPDARKLLAVMGMDVEATDWNREIMSRCIGPSLVVLLLMSLSFIMASREEILVKFKNSEEKHRHVVENATNLFYSHDTDHVLTYISPRCREFFQCEPEEAMVRWTEFLTGNPINPRGFELTQKAIETGTPQKPHELELIGKKGKKIIVEVNEAPVLKNGKTIGIVGSLTDITDRKETEKALVKERDSLAHALAEIKTLRGILPICSICKQIRDDRGYWNNLETYLSKHSMADFTHSICPKCAKEHYPDLDIYD